jgi:hypothetical protein
VEFVDRPSVGERHWVKFDGLDGLEAEVRWVSGSRPGCSSSAQSILPCSNCWSQGFVDRSALVAWSKDIWFSR